MVVTLDVRLEVTLLYERHDAVRTLVLALVAVLLAMYYQCILLIKRLVADLTDKWTFT